MPSEDLRDFYLRYVAMANAREFHRMDEFAHDEVKMNGAPVARDVMIAEFEKHTEAIPDLRWEVQELVVEGIRIAARLLDTGTPQEEWLGLSPTGGTVTFDECAFYEIRDGRIAASWYLMDADAVRRQLAG